MNVLRPMHRWLMVTATVMTLVVIPQLAVGQLSPAFRITLTDSVHNAVIRQYIAKMERSPGLSREKNVIVITPTLEVHDKVLDKDNWYVSATGRQENVQTMPTFISELDGYTVFIYLSLRAETFIRFPESHRQAVEAIVTTKLARKPPLEEKTYEVTWTDGSKRTIVNRTDNRPSEHFESWNVKFSKDRAPRIYIGL